jgi:hypothetical protein
VVEPSCYRPVPDSTACAEGKGPFGALPNRFGDNQPATGIIVGPADCSALVKIPFAELPIMVILP